MQADLGNGIVKGNWLVNDDEMHALDWMRGMAKHNIIMMLLLIESILKVFLTSI